jgi:HlyD family secretion protein
MPESVPRQWFRRALLLLALLALAGAAVWWFGRPKPVAVLVEAVSRGTVESSVANTRAGTVEACQRTRLSTIAGGRIEVLAVKEGDHVKKGQLLMRLWADDQQAEQALAQAQLDTARKRVVEACTVAELARRDFQRQQQLFQQGFISEGALDTLRTQADARVAACATARSDVGQAQARIQVVGSARQRTVLVAPFDGIVAKLVGEVGEYSTPSPPGVAMPPAIDLIDDRCLYVAAPMDEVDAPKIAVGQPVRITLDALPGRSFAGRVRRIAPYVTAVEKQARTVEIEVDFDDARAPGRLLVGYSADVEVILDAKRGVLRVPSSALLQGEARGEGKAAGPGGRVLLLQEGRLVERPVKAGLSNWEHTEIVDGLQGGERVVTSLDRAGVKAGAAAVEDAAAPK